MSSRWAISALAVAFLLGAPGVTYADEGRCMAVGGTGFVWEPGVLDSVDPVELESPDPDAAPLEAPIPVRDALACAGADDVRCQPLHEGDSPSGPRALSSGPDAMLVTPIVPAHGLWRVRDDAFGRTALLGAGRDATRELLRPPRA